MGGAGAPHIEIIMASHFKEREPACWRPVDGGNHNWLRISRVLQCLGLCSMFEEQAAFYQCLESLHQKGVPCDSAMPHWQNRAQTKPASGAQSKGGTSATSSSNQATARGAASRASGIFGYRGFGLYDRLRPWALPAAQKKKEVVEEQGGEKKEDQEKKEEKK